MENEINDFIDAIQKQNFNSAKDHFDSLVGEKLNDALEQEKIAVADTIFNDAAEEQIELDFDDDDLIEDEIED